MRPQKEPIHINAKHGDIAEYVLFPGDPLRAKYIADHFLKNVKQVTDVRNMLGFTGEYKGKRITVMGHGMGMPSVSIYAFELFYYYNVQKIIRIGTCGVCSKEVNIPEIIVADKIFTESNWGFQYDGSTNSLEYPSAELLKTIERKAHEKNLKIHEGTLITSDIFGPYGNDDEQIARVPKDLKVLGEEMEGFALLHLAYKFERQAAVIVTAVDSKFTDKVVSSEERQTSLDDMISLGLESLID